MSFSLIGHVTAVANNDATTGSIDTTGADLIVIHIAQSKTTTLGTVSDSKGNTYTALTLESCSSGDVKSQLLYSKAPTVGSGHTFSYNGTGKAGVISVQAWSGANTSAPFDVGNGEIDGGLTSAAVGSVTPSVDNELVVTGISPGSGYQTSLTIDSSFTVSDKTVYSGGVNFSEGMAYKVQTTAAAVNPTWSWDTSDFSAANIATFKAAVGAAANDDERNFPRGFRGLTRGMA